MLRYDFLHGHSIILPPHGRLAMLHTRVQLCVSDKEVLQ